MTRPVGRPSRKPKVFFHAFSYRAASWKKPRRVIAKRISDAIIGKRGCITVQIAACGIRCFVPGAIEVVNTVLSCDPECRA